EEVQRLTEQGGVTQRLGAQLPLDTPFFDEQGRPVTLGDYFRGDKPVVLEFAYFECPLLCPMMMRGIQDALRGVSASSPVGGAWVPGEDFDVVTISINPDDTPVAAAEKKQELRERFAEGDEAREVEPRPDLAEATLDGWHFLTGREVDIRAAADAAGFGYAPVPQTSDFAHPAVIIFASPDGVITRYLPSHRYPVRDFRLALTEAAEGKQGSLFDMFLQLCYYYDDSVGVYTADYLMIMKLGGVVTLVTLSGIIGGMLIFEKKRKGRFARQDAEGDTPPPGSSPSPA
ncbi:MAG: SCO family protein, partial [Planctomycetota bacterium]